VNDYNTIICGGGGSGIAWAAWTIAVNAGQLRFAASSANAGYDIGSDTTAAGNCGAVSLGAWHHFEVVNSAGHYYGFLDGVKGLDINAGLYPYDYVTAYRGVTIGTTYQTAWSAANAMPTAWLNGYIDELVIMPNVALHTANFTPPTGEY
jgi:hypothetical protein